MDAILTRVPYEKSTRVESPEKMLVSTSTARRIARQESSQGNMLFIAQLQRHWGKDPGAGAFPTSCFDLPGCGNLYHSPPSLYPIPTPQTLNIQLPMSVRSYIRASHSFPASGTRSLAYDDFGQVIGCGSLRASGAGLRKGLRLLQPTEFGQGGIFDAFGVQEESALWVCATD